MVCFCLLLQEFFNLLLLHDTYIAANSRLLSSTSSKQPTLQQTATASSNGFSSSLQPSTLHQEDHKYVLLRGKLFASRVLRFALQSKRCLSLADATALRQRTSTRLAYGSRMHVVASTRNSERSQSSEWTVCTRGEDGKLYCNGGIAPVRSDCSRLLGGHLL